MNSPIPYILHLADTALILSHRNSEWCGHGPVLEQDIAITNISLDLLGQARYFYQHASALINRENGNDASTEDSLAYLRTEREFRNLLITELPNGDWARTILRQFVVSVFQEGLYEKLQHSKDEQMAAIAAKSLKEVKYHVKWSSEWVLRLGDGTDESNQRMKSAIEDIWPYTGEMFNVQAFDTDAAANGTGVDPSSIQSYWNEKVNDVFSEAGLPLPEKTFMQSGGKIGIHTENLGYILSDLQYLQRAYPGAEW
jgi:ring-1,2-phenylacetyl-CoA epoxidase subunit PaaC